MDYVSTLSFESTTTEGVTFEVYKPSTQRNIEFNRVNAAFREKARSLQSDINANERDLREDARKWQRAQEAAYAKAKSALAAAGDNKDSAEAVEAAQVIAGYEADKAIADLRRQIAAYDLEALADAQPDDPTLVELQGLMSQIEEKALIATSYEEPAALSEERAWLRREADIMMDEFYRPARVKWGVASIKGININGSPATVDSQLAFGPPDLTTELFNKVEEVSRLSPDKLKKSSLPTISSAPVVGSENNTTASDASKTSSTPPVTAPSISLG